MEYALNLIYKQPLTIYGVSLNREEAVIVLKRMVGSHSGDMVNYVNIVAPKDIRNSLSEGYQIHMKGSPYHSIKDLETLVEKYGLAVKEENNIIVIYKPKIST